MVVLSVFEKLQDAASRLMPCDSMDTVEFATRTQLTEPHYGSVVSLCHLINGNTDSVVDVTRAIRRRIAVNDARVQYLTVLLLDTLIRQCVIEFHIELADHKGLLRDLQNIAVHYPCVFTQEQMAKDAALELILNLSVWFTGHSNKRLNMLSRLADDVREEAGANTFENIRPDTHTQIEALKVRRQSSQHTGAHTQPQLQRRGEEQQWPTAPIVDAIGVNFTTDETLGTMVDCCTTFAEYLGNTKLKEDGSIEVDDVIREFYKKVSSDRAELSILLRSDLKLPNREMLNDVYSSQTALIQRLGNEAALDLSGTDPQQQQGVQEQQQQIQEQGQQGQGLFMGVVPTGERDPHSATATQQTGTAVPVAVTMPPISAVEPTAPLETANTIEDLFEPAPATSTIAASSHVSEKEVVEESGNQERMGEEESREIKQPRKEEGEKTEGQVQEERGTQEPPAKQENEPPASTEDDFDAFLEGRAT